MRTAVVVASLLALTVVLDANLQKEWPPRPPQPSPPRQPSPAQDGPFTHQVMSASSADGLTWTHDNRVLLEHASVPAAIVTPEGYVRLYYVDASTAPEHVNCAESRDDGRTFLVLGCTIENRGGAKAVDPSIVLLPDGRYRLYYYASAEGDPGAPGLHGIDSAISGDGIHFVNEGEVFLEPGLVDPDVFWSGREWLMYVMSLERHGTVMAKSDDGLSFSFLGMMSPEGWGTTAPITLADGRFRLYAFDQRTQREVRSFTSSNGISWTMEDGVRIHAREGQQITDPFVLKLPSGGWKMFFKASRAPNQNP